MTDLDQPLTRREFREFRVELDAVLQTFATKDELRAVKDELRSEINAAKDELRSEIGLSISAARDELRTHFDVVAESLRSEFRNLFDWVHTNTTSLSTRVDALETDHGTRLAALDLRVTRLESRRKKR